MGVLRTYWISQRVIHYSSTPLLRHSINVAYPMLPVANHYALMLAN